MKWNPITREITFNKKKLVEEHNQSVSINLLINCLQ